jgi:ribosome-associated toxin RatA of RatAB toxin-antitoxin module
MYVYIMYISEFWSFLTSTLMMEAELNIDATVRQIGFHRINSPWKFQVLQKIPVP